MGELVTAGTVDADLQVALSREWGLLIGGQCVPAASGRRFVVESPVTDEPIAEVPDGDEEDVARAIEAAGRAWPGWRRTAPRTRARHVREMAAVLLEHRRELALLDAIDGGNPVAAMEADVSMAADAMNMFADWALELQGATIPASAEHVHMTVREPFGVVGRIVPFNHPIMFAASKVAAPLIAGNTVVLKPSETTPLSALRMGELMRDVLPPGVLSVVVGDGPAVGRAITRHPLVRRIAFTGGERTGRAIQRDAAEVGVKSVTLELGGKNAILVCEDADLDRAAGSVVAGMNFAKCQGQSCGSTSRLLAHESIKDALLARVLARVDAIRIGSPLERETEMGTMASRAQYERAVRYIAIGREEGAELVAGGGRPDAPGTERGLFVAPTVFDGVQPDMQIARTEIFGPVLSVMTWSGMEDAVATANAVDYGLAASVWTSDVTRAHHLSRELQAGYVWINGSARHFPGVPFGGMKNSGVGREESFEELESYTELKAINLMLE